MRHCSASMEPSWFTITGCSVIVLRMHLCVDHLWLTCCTSPTIPEPMHSGRPNVAGIRGPGPVRHLVPLVNRYRCLEILSNVRWTTVIQFARLLGRVRRVITGRYLGSHLCEQIRCPQVPKMRSASFGWWQPILPVSLPLPRFATQNVAPYIGSHLRSRFSSINHRLGHGRKPIACI